jgi:hypothetical protein
MGWRRGVLLMAVLLAGGASGCAESDSLGRKAISGAVTLDGAPVESGNSSFQAESPSITSGGAPIAAGKYSIPQQLGLPVGKYRVTISAPKPGTGGTLPEGALPGDPLPPPEELIPRKWNVDSEQFIEVTEKGPYVFNFDVKSKE